jgi:hypothetical protein
MQWFFPVVVSHLSLVVTNSPGISLYQNLLMSVIVWHPSSICERHIPIFCDIEEVPFPKFDHFLMLHLHLTKVLR